jgi:hypothetical protein
MTGEHELGPLHESGRTAACQGDTAQPFFNVQLSSRAAGFSSVNTSSEIDR